MSIEIVAQGLVVGDFGMIRQTEDGSISAFDLIAICGEGMDRSYPRKTLENIKKEYPEVGKKIHYFKFAGRGQKETPVVDKETALQIIGLLPGLAGKKYRALAAKLVLNYLENPALLAEVAIARIETPEELAKVDKAVRAKYLEKGYHPLMDNVRERLDDSSDRWAYIKINQSATEAAVNKSPKKLQAERYQGKAKNPPSARQLMNDQELKLVDACHSLQSAALITRDVRGTKTTVATCVEMADAFKQLLIDKGLA